VTQEEQCRTAISEGVLFRGEGFHIFLFMYLYMYLSCYLSIYLCENEHLCRGLREGGRVSQEEERRCHRCCPPVPVIGHGSEGLLFRG